MRDAADMPSESKCNFLILSATQLEADSGSDLVGMRHYLSDVDPHIMRWVGISPNTCLLHDSQNMVVAKEEKLSRSDSKNANRLPKGN